jgi:murein L,D-transpeptidase YafK
MEKVFNGIVKQIQIIDQGRYAINNNRRRHNSNLLDWDVEIKNKIYHIYVNRSKKTVTIGGEAEDWKEKEKVEHIIELRAPDNFEIINKIEITNKGLG